MSFRPAMSALVLFSCGMMTSAMAQSQTSFSPRPQDSAITAISTRSSGFRMSTVLQTLEPDQASPHPELLMATAAYLPAAPEAGSPAPIAGDFDTTPDTAAAAENNQEGFTKRALKRGLEDQKEIWTAPFHRKNMKWDALFLAGTGLLIAYDEEILHAVPNNGTGVSSNISNAIIAGTGVSLGGIYFIKGLHGGDEHAKETGVLAIETLANTFLVYAPLQLIAGRQRPNEGTGEGNFFQHHSVNTSFPGGHSMFEFAMATTIAHEYPRWWVQFLSYGAATALTGARMTAKMHFPSDLLVGGALGYLIGTHIFHAHCNPEFGSDCHSSDKEGP